MKPISSLNEQIKKYVKVGEQIHKNTNTTTRGGQMHLQNKLQNTFSTKVLKVESQEIL